MNKEKSLYILCVMAVLAGGLFFGYSMLSGSFSSASHSVSDLSEHASMTAQEHVQEPLPDIDKTPLAQRPMRDKLVAMLEPGDPNSIFTVIDAIQADPALSLKCHDIAHDLGHRAYELYGFTDAMTFDNPNHVKHPLPQYICAGGYMHGILEEMSLHHPEFLTEPEIICGTVPDSDRASCFHGMGHVFMLHYKRDAEASIVGCRVIKLKTDMYRCFEGVRMEQFWGNTGATSTAMLGWDITKPLDPCIGVQEDEKPTCFLYSTFGYLRTHVRDYPGATKMCTESELDDSDAQFCLKGLGMTMMSKFKGEHMEGSEAYVDGLPAEEKEAFYKGVTGYARISGVDDEDLKGACMLLKNDTQICLQALEESR